MTSRELIDALTSIGKPVCIDVADKLTVSTGTNATFDLHLRRAGLNSADAQVLADAMLRSDTGHGLYLGSFSASFNPDLGDSGAIALVRAFPETLKELGLVGCSIGDSGGRAILEWASTSPKLQMVCIEGNKFSSDMRSQFQVLTSLGRNIQV